MLMGYNKLSFILLVVTSATFDATDSRNSCKCICSHSGATTRPSLRTRIGPARDPCAGAKPKPQTKIYEGRDAQEGERPFQAHLYLVRRDETFSICGGSIYNSNTVITAAHCLFDFEPESILSTVGDLKFSADPRRGQWSVATEFLLHPGYNHSHFDGGHDLALIRLNGSYTYNKVVQPIGLIEPSAELVGKPVLVSGWGQTSLGKGPLKFPESLQLVDLTIISNQACAKELILGGRPGITDEYFETKICAFAITSTRSGCPGDSGGPLTCQVETPEGPVTKLCGVVHGGYGCGCGLPDIYTDMTDPKMYEWIRENAGEPDRPIINY